MALTDIQVRSAKGGLRPMASGEGGHQPGSSDQQQAGTKRSGTGSTPSRGKRCPEYVKTDKPYKLADEKGLYLEVHPNGGKYWRFKYRFPVEKRLSLGVYPEVSLAAARQARDECRRQIHLGIDPGVSRKAKKEARTGRAANSFEVVAREWLKQYIDPKAESHRKRVYARFVNDVFPQIGSRPIEEITAKELLTVIRKIEDRGAGDTAHRTLGSCGQVLRYAISTARCQRDVAADLRGALEPVAENNFAAVTKPEEVAGILRAIDAYRGTFVVRSALRLAPLVFVRPGELRTAKWQDIHLEQQQWCLKLSKRDTSKSRRTDIDDHLIVPLSRQAMEILWGIHALTGDGVYVFPNARDRERPMSENAILAALRQLGIPGDQMCGHGFRATARTILAQDLKIREDLIEQELGHQVSDPNGRAYNRATFLPERCLMMQHWADYLDELKSGKNVTMIEPKPITDIRAIMVPGYM